MPDRLPRFAEDSRPPGVPVEKKKKLLSSRTWKTDKGKEGQREEQMEYIMSKLDPNQPIVYVDSTGEVVKITKREKDKQKELEKQSRSGASGPWQNPSLPPVPWQKPGGWQNPLLPIKSIGKGRTWSNNFDDDKSEERKNWVVRKEKHDEMIARADDLEEEAVSRKEDKSESIHRAVSAAPRLWQEDPEKKKKEEKKRKFESKALEPNKKWKKEPEIKKFNRMGKPIHSKKPIEDAKPAKPEKEDRVAQKVGRAKLIWNDARIKEQKPDERQVLIDKLMKIIGDDIKGFIFKHDGSRILQTCLKYGTKEQKKKLLTELLPETLNIAQHEFSHFLAIKIFKYSDQQQRMQFLAKITGQVLRIFKYKFGAKIIEKVYEDGNNRVKQSLLAEFYGREFALFKQNEVPKNLHDILKTCTPEKKQKILSDIKENLVGMLSAKGETLVPHTVLHRVMWEYLSNADPKGIREVVSILESLLLLFIHTHEGAKCGAYCFLYGNAKERKSMLKALKDHVPTIATSPYAYLVILTALARVDDTTLSTKSLLQPLLGSLADLALEPTSARLLLITLAAPSLRCFTQEEVGLIEHDAKVPQEGHPENLVATSLKDPATRRAQLADYLAAPLAEACVARVMELMISESGAYVLFELIKLGRFEVLRAVLDIIERSDTTPEDEEVEKAEGEEEDEFYWTSKPSTMLLARLIKELPEKEKEELLEKLVASFGDNILHWAVKSSNASYLIKDILLHVDAKTQQKLAKQLASAAPDTRIGRAVAEIKGKATSNGVNGKQKTEEKGGMGKKAAAPKEEKPAPKKDKKVEEEEQDEQTEGLKRKRVANGTATKKPAKKPTK